MRITTALLFSAAASSVSATHSLLDRAVHKFYKRDELFVARDTTGSPSNPDIPISRNPLSGQSDLDTVLNALTVIEQLTVNATWTIGNFTGNLNDALKIQQSTTTIDDATYNASLACGQIGNLSVSDAFTLGSFTQNLAYAVNASIATLISKKPLFVKLSLASVAVSSLQALQAGTFAFGETVTAKVPQELQIVSQGLVSQTVASITEGINCFNGTDSACITTIVNPSRTQEQAYENGTLNSASGVQATGWFTLVLAVLAIVAAV